MGKLDVGVGQDFPVKEGKAAPGSGAGHKRGECDGTGPHGKGHCHGHGHGRGRYGGWRRGQQAWREK